MSTTALLDPTHYSFPWHGHPVQNAEIFLYPSQWVNDKNVMKCDKNFKSWGEGFREGQWHQDLSIYWTQLSIDLDDMTTSNELLRSKKSGGQYHQDRKRVVRFPNPLAPGIQIHVSWETRLVANVRIWGWQMSNIWGWQMSAWQTSYPRKANNWFQDKSLFYNGIHPVMQ